MTCEECGGPLPVKPHVWTTWSDAGHIWADHQFCSGVCRDTWLRRRHIARCHRCGEQVHPSDVVFRWVAEERHSMPFHRECL